MHVIQLLQPFELTQTIKTMNLNKTLSEFESFCNEILDFYVNQRKNTKNGTNTHDIFNYSYNISLLSEFLKVGMGKKVKNKAEMLITEFDGDKENLRVKLQEICVNIMSKKNKILDGN